MAFLGRVNSEGTLIDCEVFSGRLSKIQPQQSYAEDGADALLPRPEGSRTLIRTYDEDSLLRSMGSPSTVRYVGSSVSSSETPSLDETETSTLRCSSRGSAGTLVCHHKHHECPDQESVSETLCLDLDNPSSSPSSSSTPSSSSSRGSSRSSSSKDSTTSMCSWEEAMSRGESLLAPPEDPLSLSLPSLRLGSHGGSPPLTYTRRLDPHRVERSANEAFENWLSGKRRNCQLKARAEQVAREEQRERTALRQRLAKEKYEQWCQQKARQAIDGHSRVSQSTRVSPGKEEASVKHQIQEWELQKIRLAEQRRLELRNAERRKQQEQRIRQEEAEQAFQRWMNNVAQRPKPVPSSQGIQSLRGTVSKIFINPNRWVD
ncbi:coiled-coil domain-containing protein 34 [Drosophila ficusphila]|uniref:coiled-coil domain-containing protein 34 n=1 Tax=Drosophila ficusphila TaxID=30025 RepID=UPI0007E78E03|nr:coiled-coil domain-containing protein 34 [Drosophila ficusphila]